VKSRLGYLFGGVLVLFAFAVAGIAISSAISTMEGMQRVAMPGTAEVTLPAGPSTLYVETRSKLGDRVIESDGDFNFRCDIPGVELHKPRSSVRYSMAGYRGHNAFDVEVGSGGRYALTCEPASTPPFVIAIGAGVGSWIVIAVVAVLPLLGGIALVIVTFVRRRLARRVTASGTASAR
jgi:hypothetical protein